MADPVERAAADAGAALDFLDTGIGFIAPCQDNRGAICIFELAHIAQSDPHRMIAAPGSLERAFPAAVIDVDRADLDPMLARIPHDLGGRIKAHGLGV